MRLARISLHFLEGVGERVWSHTSQKQPPEKEKAATLPLLILPPFPSSLFSSSTFLTLLLSLSHILVSSNSLLPPFLHPFLITLCFSPSLFPFFVTVPPPSLYIPLRFPLSSSTPLLSPACSFPHTSPSTGSSTRTDSVSWHSLDDSAAPISSTTHHLPPFIKTMTFGRLVASCHKSSRVDPNIKTLLYGTH